MASSEVFKASLISFIYSSSFLAFRSASLSLSSFLFTSILRSRCFSRSCFTWDSLSFYCWLSLLSFSCDSRLICVISLLSLMISFSFSRIDFFALCKSRCSSLPVPDVAAYWPPAPAAFRSADFSLPAGCCGCAWKLWPAVCVVERTWWAAVRSPPEGLDSSC